MPTSRNALTLLGVQETAFAAFAGFGAAAGCAPAVLVALVVVAGGGVNALSHLVVVIDQLAQRVQ
ncbi:MAG: hypothetical protein HOQ28_16700, partial [Thermoleophilia bacterium]|nr:hypothetical protein [Thermoleophilia bacterium]